MARGTWQGGGTWQTSGGGGGLVLAVILGALLIGSGAVSAAVSALITIVIILGCVVGLAVLGGAAWLVYRARQDRPGRTVAAPAAYQLAPGARPRLEASERPAIEPREIHIHIHAADADRAAAIIRQALPGTAGDTTAERN